MPRVFFPLTPFAGIFSTSSLRCCCCCYCWVRPWDSMENDEEIGNKRSGVTGKGGGGGRGDEVWRGKKRGQRNILSLSHPNVSLPSGPFIVVYSRAKRGNKFLSPVLPSLSSLFFFPPSLCLISPRPVTRSFCDPPSHFTRRHISREISPKQWRARRRNPWGRLLELRAEQARKRNFVPARDSLKR